MHRAPSSTHPKAPAGRAGARCAVALLCGALIWGCQPEKPLETARQLQQSGAFQASLEPLRERLDEQPDDPEAGYLYGRALLRTGRPSLAMWALRQAMEDPEWREAAGILLARAALINRDFNVAIDATTRILEDDPENATALLFRAQAHAHWRSDPEAALADANRALELAPDLLEAYEPLVLAFLALDREAEAREALEEAGRRLKQTDAPGSVLAWHCATTADFASGAGDEERAREVLEECLEAHPSDATVVSNALAFYDARGEPDRSLEVLRAAFEVDPQRRDLRGRLAERMRWAGEVGEAEALLREATEVEGPLRAAAAWEDLARFRQAMGEWDAAADALEQAIERTREATQPSEQLLFRYADALLLSGQLGRALEVGEELSVPAERHLVRGRVAQERGRYAQALEEFDEAVRLWPDNPSAHYYAARSAEQLGDFERAIEEYRYSIRADVAATDARTRVAKLLLAKGRPMLAYQLLFLEVSKAPLEAEGTRLAYYLLARTAAPKQLQAALQQLGASAPASLPNALAAAAEGVTERVGAAGAVNLLAGAPGIDYANPRALPVLHALVRYAHEADRPAVAEEAVEKALAAHPDFAAFHAIRGLHLEGTGDPKAARKAYQQALTLAPENVAALIGLGRLAADPETALGFYERAIAADPRNAEAQLGAARSLEASGRAEEAASRLEALLDQQPLSREAAAELVALDLARGDVTHRTLEQAARAVQLDGGPEDYERLSRVYAQLEQPEQAEVARERARHLRERGQAPRDDT